MKRYKNLPNSLASPPDLHLTDLLHLLLVLLTVVLLGVVLQASLGLLTVLDAVVELVEQGLEVILELAAPVDGTTTGSGRASSIHPVHAVGTDQGVQGLSGLLNSLVEGLAGAVATLTEDLVLSEEHTVDTAHQATTLAVEIGVDLLLEGGLVEVAGADGNTEGNSLLLGLTGDVLVDGNGGVDTTTLTEERADGTARALGSDENDVDVLGDLNLGEILEDGGETVREVESLALGQLGGNGGPGLGLSSVGKQVHDDGTALNGVVDLEQVLAGNPAVLNGLLPGSTILADTNDDVETVVTEVQALAVALRAVTDEGEGVIFEVLL